MVDTQELKKSLILQSEVSHNNLTYVRFVQEMAERGYKYNEQASHPADPGVDLDKADLLFASGKAKYALFVRPDAVGYIGISWGDATFYVTGETEQIKDDLLAELKELVPEADHSDPSVVSVTFWSLSQHGPSSIRRNLDVPSWNEIKLNYTKKTLAPLEKLMNVEYRPGRGGQLFLWHGEPGTGKTTALRALAREWKDWCSIHYIADPERFFGSEANYMLQVLTDEENDSLPGRPSDPTDEKWRLLVLEDCGELLSADARTLSGQGLSRFLNAVDGLIGQGLRIIVLVTTNEELGKMHPAVQRPGRCAANIEFYDLKDEEVARWVKANKVDQNISGNKSIAELYALIEGRIESTPERTMGFGV